MQPLCGLIYSVNTGTCLCLILNWITDAVFTIQELIRSLSSCWWRYSVPSSLKCSNARGRLVGLTCYWRSSPARERQHRSRANRSTFLFHSPSPTTTRNTKSVLPISISVVSLTISFLVHACVCIIVFSVKCIVLFKRVVQSKCGVETKKCVVLIRK